MMFSKYCWLFYDYLACLANTQAPNVAILLIHALVGSKLENKQSIVSLKDNILKGYIKNYINFSINLKYLKQFTI